MNKKGLKGILSVLMCGSVLLSGCSEERGVSLDPIGDRIAPEYNAEYYDNYQFNDYYNPEGAAEHLPDQGVYGSGNAFILRYNGKYYMYMGSSNFASSTLPCWVSEDLMTWRVADNGINAKGAVAEDPRLYNSYPPCVRQYNGEFYMYLYIKNDVVTQGNYILKANSPVGPFEFVTDKQNNPVCYTISDTSLNIDCDIFIDDNEDVYFMSGHQDAYFTGIRAFKMPSMDTVLYDKDNYINIAESSVGGWTEGNGMFKRNGNYYLMYTGSNILSPGYLTHYSSAIGDDWKKAFSSENYTSAPGFEQGIDWPMGCETQKEFYSLGHATSILGPDMDGIYYHYFSVNSSGPNCSFAIDRLIFNGTGMDTAQTQYHSVKPKMPDVYSYSPVDSGDFTSSAGKVLSVKNSSAVFSVEYNFRGNDVKNVFGYENENNYFYVKTDLSAKKISVYRVENGKTTEKASGSIVRAYDKENLLQTVRVAYRDGKLDVYFDDLLKIENAEVSVPCGKIGYIYGDKSTLEYTALSSVAKGLSDSVEPKQSYINIGAESYLPQGVYAGLGSSFTSGGYSTVSDEYDGKYAGLGKMTVKNAGDSATYIVDFDETRDGGNNGYYTLQFTMNKNQSGKKIGVRVDGGKIYVLELPKVDPSNGSALIKTSIGQIPVEKGVREISFVSLGDEFSFHSFTFVKSSSETFDYSQDLSVAPEKGMEQLTLWRIEKTGDDEVASLVSREGARSLVYFGDSSVGDYVAECDFRINTDSIYTAGFIIHGARFSNSAYVSEDYKYMQGYYLALNKRMVKFEKLNYTHTDGSAAAQRIALNVGEWNHVKIEVKGNTITATVTNSQNQAKTVSFTDDIVLNGRFGFYTSGASMSYKNLRITG